MKFRKDKCRVLHLGWCNQRAQYWLGFVWLESSLAERDLEVLVDNKLNWSQQSAAAAAGANQVQGSICRVITSRDGDVIVPLSASQAAPWSTVLGFVSYSSRKTQTNWRESKGLENLPCKGRLKECPCLEKRRIRGTSSQYSGN